MQAKPTLSGLAQELQKQMSPKARLDDSLLARLGSTLVSLPLKPRNLTVSDRTLLDTAGTALWNTVTKTNWQDEDNFNMPLQAQSSEQF